MTKGLIRSKTLAAIADAVRTQEGSTAEIAVSQLAARVRALDGTKQGTPAQLGDRLGGVGFIEGATLAGLADAIRAQNGSTVTYRPSEMAPAILALSWNTALKPRALLLSNGSIEFNYREGVSTSYYGVEIINAWEINPAGYNSASERPWDKDKQAIYSVYFAPDFAGAGVSSTAYFFHGCTNLLEIMGFEVLQGVTNMNQMFVSCSNLRTIYAAQPPASVTSGSIMFSGCSRLVGATGYVSKQTDTHAKLTHDGVLTNPRNDLRHWVYGFAYADGELAISRSNMPDTTREVLAEGAHCLSARYNAVGAAPWYGARSSITRATIDPDVDFFADGNLNYWFYGLNKLSSITGLQYFNGVGEMQHAFNSCTSLASIDLRGFDPSKLTSLFYTFAGCKALTTITVGPTWELPTSGLTGPSTFNGCTSIVGGNGTAYGGGKDELRLHEDRQGRSTRLLHDRIKSGDGQRRPHPPFLHHEEEIPDLS